MDGIIRHELEFGLASFFLGVLLMAAYDMLRIFRRVVKHNIAAVSLEDFLYWLACLIVIFEFLRVRNQGIFRYSVALMSALGMGLYHAFLGKYAVPFLAKALNRLKKWERLLTEPLKKAMMKICKPIKGRFYRGKKKHEGKSSDLQREKK